MSHGYGFGKIILFGEHFVVYGLPAIVSAINRTIEVTLEKSSSWQLIDNTTKFPGVQELTWDLCKESTLSVFKYFGVPGPVKIIVHGDLPLPNSGIGSSAANLVALARAINSFFDLGASKEDINRAAYEGEKEIHGSPSGIDNTAATYGGTFWFEKREENNLVEKINLVKKPEIILVESGVPTETRRVIYDLKKFINKNREYAKEIFDEYKNIVQSAKTALISNDLKTVGNLMYKNHELLKKLNLSCQKLDSIIEIARESGALGAKLTGTGRGGLAIILAPEKPIQKNVLSILSQKKLAFFSAQT
jgi:mevalonate kinase